MSTLNRRLVVDKQVDVQETYTPTEIVPKSGICKTVYKYDADSVSNSNWTWNNITPPSLTTVVSRDFTINYSLIAYVSSAYDRVTVGQHPGPYPLFNAIQSGQGNNNSGTVGAPWPVAGGVYSPVGGANTGITACLRAYPLHAVCSALQLFINGQSTSVSPYDYSCLFPYTLNDYEKSTWVTGSAAQPDVSTYMNTLYDDWATYVGSVRSPLVPRNGGDEIQSRSSLLPYVASIAAAAAVPPAQATPQLDTYIWNLYEQLMISPLQFGDDSCDVGLSNVNLLTIKLNFGDLTRALTVALKALAPVNGAAAGSVPTVSCSLVSTGPPSGFTSPGTFTTGKYTNPCLYLTYITQDPIMEAKQPEVLYYSYENLTPYITPWTTAVGGFSATGVPAAVTTGVIPLQALRLSTIPQKLYIYVRPSRSGLLPPVSGALAVGLNGSSCYYTDSFLRITGMQINFDNRSTLFATYSEMDLYKMSVRNGLRMSFYDWQYGCGSVIIVDLTRDIQLPASDVAGMANKYSTLQVTLNVSTTNVAYSSFLATPGNTGNAITGLPYDAYILVQLVGKAVISKSSMDLLLVGPSSAEVIELTQDSGRHVSEEVHEMTAPEGGSVLGTVGRFLSKGLDRIANIDSSDVDKAKRIASSASSIINTIAGDGGAIVGAAMPTGGATVGAGMRRRY